MLCRVHGPWGARAQFLSWRLRALVLGCAVAGFGGCSTQPQLMPTPRVYAHPGWDPFAAVPDALQGSDVSVLYVTDRMPDAESESGYGQERSRSVAFGHAIVELGELPWEDLVAASRTEDRTQAVPLSLGPVSESARFDETPPSLLLTEAELAGSDKGSSEHAAAERLFLTELSARLARSPTKQVFLYVHGYNNTFEDAVLTTAELWHFLGREGVPICYTWPAGVGVFRAYQYTIASTDFTILHQGDASADRVMSGRGADQHSCA